ncbi:hypothetical protein MTO96_031087 [Rhipicephalus appendiculatus]
MASFNLKRLVFDEESFDKQRERDSYTYVRASFCLLLLIPVVLCIIFAALFITYSRPTDQGDTTPLEKSPELHIATPCTPDHMQPPKASVPIAKPVPDYSQMRQSRGALLRVQSPNVCSTQACTFVAQWIRNKISPLLRPCDDFYQYVCHAFKDTSQLNRIDKNVAFAAVRYAVSTVVPKTKQTIYQKAAGMVQACMNFIRKGLSEVYYLRQWMISLGLNLFNIKQMEKLDPFDLIVRLSLDQGVPALLEMVVQDVTVTLEHRRVTVRYSDVLKDWIVSVTNLTTDQRKNGYASLVKAWGIVNSVDSIVSNIINYDDIRKTPS